MSNFEEAKRLATEAREAYLSGDNLKYGILMLQSNEIIKELSKENKEKQQSLEAKIREDTVIQDDEDYDEDYYDIHREILHENYDNCFKYTDRIHLQILSEEIDKQWDDLKRQYSNNHNRIGGSYARHGKESITEIPNYINYAGDPLISYPCHLPKKYIFW